MLGIDACPMEGLDKHLYDEILGLKGGEYATAVVATAGDRSAEDSYHAAPKVRFDIDEVVSRR
jgi:hypothetical protein